MNNSARESPYAWNWEGFQTPQFADVSPLLNFRGLNCARRVKLPGVSI